MKKILSLVISLCAVIISLIVVIGSAHHLRAQLAFTQNQATVRCVSNLPEVTLLWTPSAYASYYRIERKSPPTAAWSGILDSQIKATKYVDTRWKSDYGVSTYVYRIQARRVSTTTSGTYSNEISIAVPECRSVATSTPAKFVKGDKITVRKDQSALNVRGAPLISSPVLGTQGASALGSIIGGPSYDSVNKYWFWQVNFDTGVDGWSVEYWIDKVTSASPPPIIPPPAPKPPTPPNPIKMPSHLKWGVYAGWSNSAMTEFETLTGKKPNMEMVFVHWGNETQFPFYYSGRIKDKGRTMVLFWEASDYKRDPFTQPEYSVDSVLAGKLDLYFKNFAAGAKTYGGPVIIIPYSEMNGNWYGWGGTVGTNTPAKLIAAYRYVHKFFVGIPNVKFGWAPNNDSVPDTPTNQMESYYPGDDVVDYVGVDGFNFGGTSEQTFSQAFSSSLTRLKQYKKPIYIFSTASSASPTKAAWIRNALTVELYKYPEVAGWLWFNQNKERDWRINSDPESLATFLSALP